MTTTSHGLSARERIATRAVLRLTPGARLLVVGAVDILSPEEVGEVAHLAIVTGTTAPWPESGSSVALAADPARLPFVAAMFDQVVATNSFDTPLETVLREVWRVLAPAGTLVLAVYRRGRWPLGRPGMSRRALLGFLDGAMFEAIEWQQVDDRHIVHATKRDGLAPIGRSTVAATARPVRI